MQNEMRDRLIELKINFVENFHCGDCQPENDKCRKCLTEKEADYLLENGVIVPPCKVGDTVYEIQPLRKRIQPYEVITVKYNGDFWYMLWTLKGDEGIYGNLEGFVDSELGRTVFLTKEEAEKALKEREGNG